MASCGCSYQDAQCYRGRQLLYEVSRLYHLLQDAYEALRLSAAERESLWQAYEQARSAYFAHLQGQAEYNSIRGAI